MQGVSSLANVTEVNFEKAKAYWPTIVTLLVNSRLIRLVLWNAKFPIVVIVENGKSVRLEQELNAPSPIFWTFLPIVTDFRKKQLEAK